MGAVFCHYTVENMEESELKVHHARVQMNERLKPDHDTYSGNMGNPQDGLYAASGRILNTEDEAMDLLDENCEKWESAQYVRYVDSNNVVRIMVGAECAT